MPASFGESSVKALVAKAISEAMRLENAMRAVASERAVVVLHYAPVLDTIEGEPPEIFPFLGSSRLSETIDRFKVSATRSSNEGVIGFTSRLRPASVTPCMLRLRRKSSAKSRRSGRIRVR
jgi:hypothetical protein